MWMLLRSRARVAVIGLLALVVGSQLYWTKHPEHFNWQQVSSLLPASVIGRPSIGKLHFLIAASQANKYFCRTLLSSTVTRYGPPVIAGWHGTGPKDAGISHLAKVRVGLDYLNSLPKSADDDLVLVVDGFDVYMQFGADVLIERYFQLVQQEDNRILQQLGPTDAERVAGPLSRHVFFGYDKGCYPNNPHLAACWAGAGPNHHTAMTFGPDTDDGRNPHLSHPRWLNSGTIMGRVREVRNVYRDTHLLINATFDPAHPDSQRDQFYMSNLWGEQEYERILAQLEEDPAAEVHKGPPDAVIPTLEPGRSYNHHIAIDYDGQLFQPWAANAPWVGFRKFIGPQYSYIVTENLQESARFRPWKFHLPGESLASLNQIFNTTLPADQALLGKSSNDLIRQSEFGSSHATRSAFGMWHCTLDKSALETFWPRFWYYPISQPLVRSALAWFRNGANPFTHKILNGRLWFPARRYPDHITLDDGGAWSDASNEKAVSAWLPWKEICQEFDSEVFSPAAMDINLAAQAAALAEA